jgi:hypothetical protein
LPPLGRHWRVSACGEIMFKGVGEANDPNRLLGTTKPHWFCDCGQQGGNFASRIACWSCQRPAAKTIVDAARIAHAAAVADMGKGSKGSGKGKAGKGGGKAWAKAPAWSAGPPRLGSGGHSWPGLDATGGAGNARSMDLDDEGDDEAAALRIHHIVERQGALDLLIRLGSGAATTAPLQSELDELRTAHRAAKPIARRLILAERKHTELLAKIAAFGTREAELRADIEKQQLALEESRSACGAVRERATVALAEVLALRNEASGTGVPLEPSAHDAAASRPCTVTGIMAMVDGSGNKIQLLAELAAELSRLGGTLPAQPPAAADAGPKRAEHEADEACLKRLINEAMDESNTEHADRLRATLEAKRQKRA